MDTRTKAAISTLASIVAIATGISSLVQDGPIIVEQFPDLFVYAFAVAILVLLATERERLSRAVNSRPVLTTAVLAGLVIAIPPGMGHGVYNLGAADTLQIATLCGAVAIIVVILLLFDSFRRGTTYNGLFPENLPDIIDLLDGAHSSVAILTDVVAYGAFSAPRRHEELLGTLTKKCREGVAVSWRAYDDERGRQHVSDQFRLTGVESGTKQERDFVNSDAVSRFLATFPGYERPRSIDEFLDKVLVKRNKDAANTLTHAGATVSANVSAPIPIYFWIIDNRRALLSFPCRGADGLREDTFVSSDHKLITMLLDIYKNTGESL